MGTTRCRLREIEAAQFGGEIGKSIVFCMITYEKLWTLSVPVDGWSVARSKSAAIRAVLQIGGEF